MVFNLTHSQLILRYKENGGRIEPYTIVIMGGWLGVWEKSEFKNYIPAWLGCSLKVDIL
jgi:hypothetical protein